MKSARPLMVLLLLWAAFLFGAGDLCPVCGNRYGTKIYRATRLGYSEKVLICEACAKRETICYICGLPVARNYTTCEDGRLICEEDTRQAVMDQDTAGRLFLIAKDWCQSLLSPHGQLPHYNVTMQLEAKSQLDRTGDIISDHEDGLLMGLTHSLKDKGGNCEHRISVLHGLMRERFQCVSVHEYGHTWLFENLPRGRRIHAATVEGFCEWLAWRYAGEQRFEREIEFMQKNVYTRGQLQAFIAAEKEHGLYRVIQWLKHGVDTKLDPNELKRILELQEPADSLPAASFLAAAPVLSRPPAPDHLVLKGISGTASRRFALINDQTFAPGEQAKVRMGTSNVVVRCVEIRDRSVVVQLAGNTDPAVIELGNQ